MKNIKVGIANGKFLNYQVEDSLTLNSLVDMYLEDTSASTEGMELRLDGTVIVDRSALVSGSMLIFSQIVKSNNDTEPLPFNTTDAPLVTPVVEVVVEKKKDLFTKDYCENTPVDEVIDALLAWAIEQKDKNKYLQSIAPFILGGLAPIIVNGKAYRVEIAVVDGLPTVITTLKLPTFFNPISFVSIVGETEKEFIKRYNVAALASRAE